MHKVRRVAMLSLHTSPLAQPGSGDAGGMNVYVRELALELAAAGVEVEIFTRLTSPDLAPTVELAPGVLVRHVPAGPAYAVPKEKLPQLVPELAAAVGDQPGARPAGSPGARPAGSPGALFDVIHSHYWVSGMAGLLLATDWQLPLVHTMHTMARVKNQHCGRAAARARPARRRRAADRRGRHPADRQHHPGGRRARAALQRLREPHRRHLPRRGPEDLQTGLP